MGDIGNRKSGFCLFCLYEIDLRMLLVVVCKSICVFVYVRNLGSGGF